MHTCTHACTHTCPHTLAPTNPLHTSICHASTHTGELLTPHLTLGRDRASVQQPKNRKYSGLKGFLLTHNAVELSQPFR